MSEEVTAVVEEYLETVYRLEEKSGARAQLVNFEGDDFHSAIAKTVEDARKLVESGFEYVCSFDEVKVFKKRK